MGKLGNNLPNLKQLGWFRFMLLNPDEWGQYFIKDHDLDCPSFEVPNFNDGVIAGCRNYTVFFMKLNS